MAKLPQVVIVGRANVGKSTLFNRLSTDVRSLTFDEAGVTRDIIKDVVFWLDRSFELVDTGGISLRKTQDQIDKQVRQRALDLLQNAAVIIFVCDGTAGIVAEDREIAKTLHKLGRTVIFAVNKADSNQAKERFFEFERLGFKNPLPISAQHGTGIGEVLDAIVAALPEREVYEEKKAAYNVVLLGKPNVGKSSLMNALLRKDRSIVADMPGTTREAIAERIGWHKTDIELVDTAGVRRKRSVQEPLEGMMVKSTLSAIDDADIVLLLIDASEGRISDQELKLAFYVFEQHKSLMLVFNKMDKVTEEIKMRLDHSLQEYDYFLKRVERMDISCISGKNVGRIVQRVQKMWERHSQTFPNEDLTLLFKEALSYKPLFRKTNPLLVRAVKQVATSPITLLMIVNQPQWFGQSQLKFFEGVMRKKYELKGVPIRFFVRKKG